MPPNPTFNKSTPALLVASTHASQISNRTILITGPNPLGIGYATASAFASQSPRLIILAGRSASKLSETISTLRSTYPESKTEYRALHLDLGSLESVRRAGAEVFRWDDVEGIDIVVNNAGVMRHGEKAPGPDGVVPVSKDGIEEMFAVNYLGHWLLTSLIMPKILAAAAAAKNTSTGGASGAGTVRIINVSSSGTYVSPFRASDIAWTKPSNSLPENERPNFAMLKASGMPIGEDSSYVPTAAYGASKTCNILFSVALNERLFAKYGVLSLALNPGEVRTELARYTDESWLERMVKKREEMGLMHWKTTGEGASTTLVAAVDPGLGVPAEDGSGVLLSDCQVWRAPSWAVDRGVAEKLWGISEGLVGQKFEW